MSFFSEWDSCMPRSPLLQTAITLLTSTLFILRTHCELSTLMSFMGFKHVANASPYFFSVTRQSILTEINVTIDSKISFPKATLMFLISALNLFCDLCHKPNFQLIVGQHLVYIFLEGAKMVKVYRHTISIFS